VLAVWLIAPAARILNDPGRHWLNHIWRRPDGSYLFSGHAVTFWPRYRRELLGLGWGCPHEMCRENEAFCREIDSGRSVDAMIRDNPIVIGVRPAVRTPPPGRR
jgi:hypothetical protein